MDPAAMCGRAPQMLQEQQQQQDREQEEEEEVQWPLAKLQFEQQTRTVSQRQQRRHTANLSPRTRMTPGMPAPRSRSGRSPTGPTSIFSETAAAGHEIPPDLFSQASADADVSADEDTNAVAPTPGEASFSLRPGAKISPRERAFTPGWGSDGTIDLNRAEAKAHAQGPAAAKMPASFDWASNAILSSFRDLVEDYSNFPAPYSELEGLDVGGPREDTTPQGGGESSTSHSIVAGEAQGHGVQERREQRLRQAADSPAEGRQQHQENGFFRGVEGAQTAERVQVRHPRKPLLTLQVEQAQAEAEAEAEAEQEEQEEEEEEHEEEEGGFPQDSESEVEDSSLDFPLATKSTNRAARGQLASPRVVRTPRHSSPLPPRPQSSRTTPQGAKGLQHPQHEQQQQQQQQQQRSPQHRRWKATPSLLGNDDDEGGSDDEQWVTPPWMQGANSRVPHSMPALRPTTLVQVAASGPHLSTSRQQLSLGRNTGPGKSPSSASVNFLNKSGPLSGHKSPQESSHFRLDPIASSPLQLDSSPARNPGSPLPSLPSIGPLSPRVPRRPQFSSHSVAASTVSRDYEALVSPRMPERCFSAAAPSTSSRSPMRSPQRMLVREEHVLVKGKTLGSEGAQRQHLFADAAGAEGPAGGGLMPSLDECWEESEEQQGGGRKAESLWDAESEAEYNVGGDSGEGNETEGLHALETGSVSGWSACESQQIERCRTMAGPTRREEELLSLWHNLSDEESGARDKGQRSRGQRGDAGRGKIGSKSVKEGRRSRSSSRTPSMTGSSRKGGGFWRRGDSASRAASFSKEPRQQGIPASDTADSLSERASLLLKTFSLDSGRSRPPSAAAAAASMRPDVAQGMVPQALLDLGGDDDDLCISQDPEPEEAPSPPKTFPPEGIKHGASRAEKLKMKRSLRLDSLDAPSEASTPSPRALSALGSAKAELLDSPTYSAREFLMSTKRREAGDMAEMTTCLPFWKSPTAPSKSARSPGWGGVGLPSDLSLKGLRGWGTGPGSLKERSSGLGSSKLRNSSLNQDRGSVGKSSRVSASASSAKRAQEAWTQHLHKRHADASTPLDGAPPRGSSMATAKSEKARGSLDLAGSSRRGFRNESNP